MSFALLNAAWPLQMPPAKKAVLIALAHFADDNGSCWPSIPKIRERTCLAERTVQDALTFLEVGGALQRTFRRGHSTLFALTPASFVTPQQPHPRKRCTPAAVAGEGCRSRTAPPQEPHLTPAAAAPRIIKNHQGNLQENRERRADVVDAPPSTLDASGPFNTEPPVLELVTNTGKPYPIYQELIDDWTRDFPGVDVVAQLRHARAWCSASPARRKTAGGMKRFLVGWLGRSQNRGSDQGGRAHIYGAPSRLATPPHGTDYGNI